MLNLLSGDFLIVLISRNVLGLSRQPSQQGKVLGERLGEAVKQVVG
jgi:hypothetical protein